MQPNDALGFALFYAYFAFIGIPLLLLSKLVLKLPFEWVRKLLHMVIVCSIFLLVNLFSVWYMAVLAAFSLVLVAYPLLALVDRSAAYRRLVVERQGGEFKNSLIVVQAAFAVLIAVFWGVLGETWKYIPVVAVMAWGFGDAAAALVGKAIGRRRIRHPRIQGAKTFEGTLAMYIVAGLAIFLSLVFYADQSWQTSIIVALLVAPVSAAVELFSSGGMDTLTVPLSVAFLMAPLMFLLTSLKG